MAYARPWLRSAKVMSYNPFSETTTDEVGLPLSCTDATWIAISVEPDGTIRTESAIATLSIPPCQEFRRTFAGFQVLPASLVANATTACPMHDVATYPWPASVKWGSPRMPQPAVFPCSSVFRCTSCQVLQPSCVAKS